MVQNQNRPEGSEKGEISLPPAAASLFRRKTRGTKTRPNRVWPVENVAFPSIENKIGNFISLSFLIATLPAMTMRANPGHVS